MEFKLKDNYYYHGLPSEDDEVIVSVIKNGLLCNSDLKSLNQEFLGFNGNNYVSLCKKEGLDKIDCCYTIYVEDSFSIIIDNVEAIKTIKLSSKETDYGTSQEFYNTFNKDSDERRFSDLSGEYQVEGSIPNSKFVAIGFPLSTLRLDMEDSEILDKFNIIKSTLEEVGLNIPIVELEKELVLSEEMIYNKVKH